jgi:hypothetical protein
MQARCPRRWKFESYSQEQRAVEKLSTDLLGGLCNTLIVWGNGGFGPTSHGHASAPNKKLQNKLAQRCPLVVGSEYRSTKTSCCHHCPVTEVTWEHNDRRRTIVKCQACLSLLSRDRNAAHVIADIFLAVCGTTTSKTEPLWVMDDAVRESNKLNTTPPSW